MIQPKYNNAFAAERKKLRPLKSGVVRMKASHQEEHLDDIQRFGAVRRISSLEAICYEDYFFGPCALNRLLNKTVTVLKNYVFK